MVGPNNEQQYFFLKKLQNGEFAKILGQLEVVFRTFFDFLDVLEDVFEGQRFRIWGPFRPVVDPIGSGQIFYIRSDQFKVDPETLKGCLRSYIGYFLYNFD